MQDTQVLNIRKRVKKNEPQEILVNLSPCTIYPDFKLNVKTAKLEVRGFRKTKKILAFLKLLHCVSFLLSLKSFMCWYFINCSLASRGHTRISVEFWFILQCNNAFNSCELVLGWRAGWFPDNGNKGMSLWDPNVSSWFLVWCSQVWAGAVNHSGVCKDHLYLPNIPWSALGIAFSKPLKWQLIPQSSRSKWEQRINIHKVLGEAGEPSANLWMSPHCCWHSTGTWSSQCSPTNPIPNWNNWFLPFPPATFRDKKKKIRIQGFLAQINRVASVLGVTWALDRCGIWTSLLHREFSVLTLTVPCFQVCTEKLMGFFHKD